MSLLLAVFSTHSSKAVELNSTSSERGSSDIPVTRSSTVRHRRY
jgi:hypothetical protein